MGSKRNRRLREEQRDLRRDEIAAPEIGGIFGEWHRDMGYIRYRVIRLLGPVGPVVVLLVIAVLLVGLVLRIVQ